MKKVEPLTRPGQGFRKFFKKLYAKFKDLPAGPRLVIDIFIILFIFGILVLITPNLRYGILNTVSSASLKIKINDSRESFPIFEAKVKINGQEYSTDEAGVIDIGEIDFGDYEVEISKNGYKSEVQEVVVDTKGKEFSTNLSSTGRRVKIYADEYLSKNPVRNFVVRTTGEEAASAIGAYGVSTLVLPASVTLEFGGLIEADYFADKPITIDARKADAENRFELIPAGQHYFLDSRGGATTIYSSDIDGGNEERFIEPTGFEGSDSELYVESSGEYALYITARRKEVVDGVQLRQLYLVNLRTKDVIEIASGSKDWELVEINSDQIIYMAKKNDPNSNENHAIISYDIKTNSSNALFSSKNITHVGSINGKVLAGEMIERGSYPGGFLLRQIVAIDVKSKEISVISKDVTITDIKVVTPTKIQYGIINPQNNSEVLFVYDTNLNEALQADEDRSRKQIVKADFKDDLYAWTSSLGSGTKLSIGNMEGKESIFYNLDIQDLEIKQWLDNNYIILHNPSNSSSGGGLVIRIDNGVSGRLP